MIWLKRLLPFVIIAVGIYAYLQYSQKVAEEQAERDREYALVTAQIWVASAKLRASPDKFVRARDSLLSASSLNRDSVFNFLNADSATPERFTPFMTMVQDFVDSLLEIEDSLALAIKDSLRQVRDTTR
ncbi:MAG: hypothetical protein JSV52_02740 [Candidatus Zixiibacteriota bacterium]|nr:MAG: hypothetical protein JSV52_02740 [candidate division Zixibacteria bacterium]